MLLIIDCHCIITFILNLPYVRCRALLFFFPHIDMCIQYYEERFYLFQKKTQDEDMITIYSVYNTVGRGYQIQFVCCFPLRACLLLPYTEHRLIVVSFSPLWSLLRSAGSCRSDRQGPLGCRCTVQLSIYASLFFSFTLLQRDPVSLSASWHNCAYTN